MECTKVTLTLPNGFTGFVCGGRRRRRPCASCGRPADFECDWKLHGKQEGKTCSRDLCSSCATQVGPDKHLCPPHAKAWAVHPRNPSRAPVP